MHAHEVLDFWFGAPRADASVAIDPRWFGKDPAFDAQIRDRFGGSSTTPAPGGSSRGPTHRIPPWRV
jgi:uncharacterized protein (DUF924 family)